MLAVQTYLQTHSLPDLIYEFGIQLKYHPELPLVILNYDQVASKHHKTHPVVRDCRQLVLETTPPHAVVSKSFTRFFNEDEEPAETRYVLEHLATTTFQEKSDGSLMAAFEYRGQKMVITRGSWADSPIRDNAPTWKELFWSLVSPEKLTRPRCTYVFELCSPYNQVVRYYPQPQLVLLTVVSLDTCQEVPVADLPALALELGVTAPRVFDVSDTKAAHELIEKEAQALPGFEGLVARTTGLDGTEVRIKMKSATYLELHHSATGVLTWKDVLKAVITQEDAELKAHPHFASWQAEFDTLSRDLQLLKNEVQTEWNRVRTLPRAQVTAQSSRLYHALYFKLLKLQPPPEVIPDTFWAEQYHFLVASWPKIQMQIQMP